MARPRLAPKYIKQAKGDLKKAWAAQRRARGTTKRRRSPATKPRRRNTMARRRNTRRKRSMARPSVTGLASAAIIADFLNKGNRAAGSSVLDAIQGGEYSKAATRLVDDAIGLVQSKVGRERLIAGAGIAVTGAVLRRALPRVHIGPTPKYSIRL